MFFRPGPGWLDIEGRPFGRRRAALSADERHAAAIPTASGQVTKVAAITPTLDWRPGDPTIPIVAALGARRARDAATTQSPPPSHETPKRQPTADSSPKDIAIAQSPPAAEARQAPETADNAAAQSIPNPAPEGGSPPPVQTVAPAPPVSTRAVDPTVPIIATNSTKATSNDLFASEPPSVSPPPASTAQDPTTESSSQGRPPALAAARDRQPDDLKLIKGIGSKNAAACNALGIFHFDQIAAWSPTHAAWVGDHLAFPGRIERESWVEQAKLLSMGFETPHAAAMRSGTAGADADAPLSEEEVADLKSAVPVFAAPLPDESRHPGVRPAGLAAARNHVPDDLQRIKGIGSLNESRLQALGIWHFAQIAAWTPAHVQWVGSYLAFPGRITREYWIAQAAALAAGGAVAAPKGRPRRAGS